MPQSTIQLRNKLFNDPKTGFVRADKLLRRAKEQNPKITMKQVKEFLAQSPISQVFQKPKNSKSTPKIHGKVGHYQADLTFLTRYQRQNSNYHILLVVINDNTKYAYVAALKDKSQETVVGAFERIRQQSINDGRPLKVLQTDNGKEFQNNCITNWTDEHNISSQYCEKDDKKCLGVAERFNRTIALMIEKYLTSKNTNRWIDKLPDFVQNYNLSFHSSIAKIPERLEMFDEVELIRKSIAHNNQVTDSAIKRGDFVRLLNKRGAFEKEGQRFTLKIYIVDNVGLNSIQVEGKHQKFNMFEVLKVSSLSQDIDNSLRQKQLDIYRTDKRIREGIEPDRRQSKRS
eukprot:NODE_156_length_16689_cov_0.273960.p5 type:complete len:344 gc:universal NODE_156_length_16689_cov_0.273960:13130-12099(-)